MDKQAEVAALEPSVRTPIGRRLIGFLLSPRVMPAFLIVSAIGLWLLDQFVLGSAVFWLLMAIVIGAVLTAYFGVWRR